MMAARQYHDNLPVYPALKKPDNGNSQNIRAGGVDSWYRWRINPGAKTTKASSETANSEIVTRTDKKRGKIAATTTRRFTLRDVSNPVLRVPWLHVRSAPMIDLRICILISNPSTRRPALITRQCLRDRL